MVDGQAACKCIEGWTGDNCDTSLRKIRRDSKMFCFTKHKKEIIRNLNCFILYVIERHVKTILVQMVANAIYSKVSLFVIAWPLGLESFAKNEMPVTEYVFPFVDFFFN